jgi:hypothetical protein
VVVAGHWRPLPFAGRWRSRVSRAT